MIDNIAYLNGLSPYEIIQNLSIDDVKNFIESLGVHVIKYKKYLIMPTICHNSIDSASSMKLYYYDNTKCFHCYTECGESMNIFQLYQNFMAINHDKISYNEAIEYVRQFVTTGEIVINVKKNNPYVLDNDRYIYYNNIVELQEYPKQVIDSFIKYYPPQWVHEGISKESMDKYNIRFSISENKAVIPHYDINNRLVGIRGRAFNKSDIDEFGKYRPITLGNVQYKHHLSYNLYGINKTKEAIKKYRRAVIVEAEKSVLFGDTFMGDDNICVAVCGSNINKYQIALLTQLLDVNEIIVAFDRDYSQLRSEQSKKCRKKIIEQCKKYTNDAKFYYLFDEHDLLKEHDSPLDRGEEVWERLYKERFKVI